MAEANHRQRKGARLRGRLQDGAASQIRSSRDQLSQGRGSIYEGGTYAPEGTSKGHRGPITQAEKEQIRLMRAEGKAQLTIACELDISLGTVQDICKRYNFPTPNKAKGGWNNRKETSDETPCSPDHGHPRNPRRPNLLADHDAGVCGRDCRLGRHGSRDAWGSD